MLFPILIVFSIVATLASYWFYKHPRKSLDVAASPDYDEVVSLDEDTPKNRRAESRAGSPLAFIFFLVLTNGLILAYIVFGGRRAVHDEEITYEELAVRRMGELMVPLLQKDTVKAVLIVPSDGQRAQLYNSMVKSLKKGHGYHIEIVAEEAPRSGLGKSKVSIPGYSNEYVSARDVNAIVADHPEAEVVILFVPLMGSAMELAQSAFPTRLFVAVFVEQGRLYDYLELVNAGIVNMAVISRGIYETSSLIPNYMSLDDIMNQHFIVITPQSVQKVASEYRQYIGLFPPESDPNFSR